MKTIDPEGGSHIYDVLSDAVSQAPARFTFNGMTFETREGETLGDARQRFYEECGFEVCTPAESAARAVRLARELEETKQRQAEAISTAGVMSEAEMRESKAPSPESVEELASYVSSLVERPHSYGTCVYAMSLAAVAAYRFVANKLGVTGFQAGCADLDILRQTRNWKHGRLLDYDKLLYPQYCNEQSFPSVFTLLRDGKVMSRLSVAAKEKLEKEAEHAHQDVVKHWRMLADWKES